MKKLKTVLSSATLLSVGGVGLLSYERIVEPPQQIEETFEGLEGIEYKTKEEAANSFITSYNTRYVVDGMDFADYAEYEQYHLEQVKEVDVYSVNNEMYLSKEDIYNDYSVENYYLYENNYFVKDEIDQIIEDKANEFIKEERFYVLRMPTRTEFFSADSGEGSDGLAPPPVDWDPVYVVSLDIKFDQTRLDVTDLWGHNIIVPYENSAELGDLRYGDRGTCFSENITIQFSKTVDCSDIVINGSRSIYTDILTNEESLDENELLSKRKAILNESVLDRFKFMDNYYSSREKIEEFIESRKETRYLWNDVYYSNKNVITNNIFVHFKEIEQDIIVEESVMCNGEILDKNNAELWAYNNYEMLVNQCIYGNISM